MGVDHGRVDLEEKNANHSYLMSSTQALLFLNHSSTFQVSQAKSIEMAVDVEPSFFTRHFRPYLDMSSLYHTDSGMFAE